MVYTIKNLFEAIHYCNKAVKCDNFQDYELKRVFYHMKRDLLYHMIKNHKIYGITITECTIDIQPSNMQNDAMNILYAFCLTYDGTELKVHQRQYSKLIQLFEVLDIKFNGKKDYCAENDNFVWDYDSWTNAINIMKTFYSDKWHLDGLIQHLCDKTNNINDIFDSFVYYFSDFNFALERKGVQIGKKTIVQVRHIKSGRTYRITLDMLRARGERMLPVWRQQHKMFSVCL